MCSEVNEAGYGIGRGFSKKVSKTTTPTKIFRVFQLWGSIKIRSSQDTRTNVPFLLKERVSEYL